MQSGPIGETPHNSVTLWRAAHHPDAQSSQTIGPIRRQRTLDTNHTERGLMEGDRRHAADHVHFLTYPDRLLAAPGTLDRDDHQRSRR